MEVIEIRNMYSYKFSRIQLRLTARSRLRCLQDWENLWDLGKHQVNLGWRSADSEQDYEEIIDRMSTYGCWNMATANQQVTDNNIDWQLST